MTANLLLQCGLYVIVLLALAKPLGELMARVYQGERTFLHPVFGWLERGTYRASGVDPTHEMRWVEYALAVLIFNALGFLAVYALQRFQGVLPLNPADLGAVSPDSSFNTAVSFATNTNWQGYAGETTMSYLTQMLALTVQNFVSAATGMAVLVALARAFARRQVQTIGNFWVDLTRSTLYVLLPLSFVLALALVSQGVVQTFGPYVKAQTMEQIDYEEAKPGPDGKPERALQYANQPEYAIAALLQMLVRYPMTWCEPLGESISAHFEYIAQNPRYSRPVREAASRAGGEWKAMLVMQEEMRRQQQKCE